MQLELAVAFQCVIFIGVFFNAFVAVAVITDCPDFLLNILKITFQGRIILSNYGFHS
jgi:hypothetical protein